MSSEVVQGSLGQPSEGPPTVEDRSAAPERQRFNCPRCQAFARQKTVAAVYHSPMGVTYLYGGGPDSDVKATICDGCDQTSLWVGPQMVWPKNSVTGPPPQGDMSPAVRQVYEEARQTAAASPRSAAALLRLALETLVNELDDGPGRLNDKIGRLKKRGLPEEVISAMDVLRVFGNNGVHPGEINLDDGLSTAMSLFDILNLVVARLVTDPRALAAMFDRLPQGAKDGIAKRDATPVRD